MPAAPIATSIPTRPRSSAGSAFARRPCRSRVRCVLVRTCSRCRASASVRGSPPSATWRRRSSGNGWRPESIMCGIAGELSLRIGTHARPERVRAMCDVMVHRGPDDFGEFAEAEVALGMRRLSIVDVAGGHQPIGNEDGSVQVVCNGEVYNSPALRSGLLARGHRFRTSSDVEVIAHLYEDGGTDALADLDGMFAFALWDRRRRRLVLGRDRVGIKPLYVAERGDRILFGSEVKCLLAAGVDAEIDLQALHDYLTLGYVPGPASILRGVRQVPPGHLLIAEPGRPVRTERYWTLEGHARAGAPRSESAWTEELVATLRAAVGSPLMADVPLAGYETYRARRLASLYARLPGLIGRRALPELVRRLPVSHARVSFDYKAKRFVAGAYLPPAAGHLWWKTVLSEDAKAALYANGTLAEVEPTVRLFERLYAESDGEELDRLQYVDARLFLPADILVKVDRMSMAHSLEARVPFLDRGVMELARRLPARLRLRGLTTKYVLRRAMAGRLPAAIVDGRKRGFNVPIPSWLVGELRNFTHDVPTSTRLRRQGLLDPDAVGHLVAEHMTRR